jgi:uncharacterized protein YdhG (YjbR/CyaY superfamily)
VKANHAAPGDIDEYIAACPPEVQPVLEKIRATIRRAVPDARETISYRMPTFTLRGVVLHFAAFRQHIGLYPPVHGDPELMAEIAPYAGEKGNLRFPLDRRIPYALIGKLAKVRAQQNRRQHAAP